MILVAYLGHGIFHPVYSSFILLQIVLSGEVLSSEIEEPQKKGE